MTTATATKPSTIILNRARKEITLDMTVREAEKIKDARKKAADFYLAAINLHPFGHVKIYGLDTAEDTILVRRYADLDYYEWTDKEYSKVELEKAF